MAIIKCPECGKEISNKAITCPGCGYPFQNIEDDNKTKKTEDSITDNNKNIEWIPNTGSKDKIFTLNDQPVNMSEIWNKYRRKEKCISYIVRKYKSDRKTASKMVNDYVKQTGAKEKMSSFAKCGIIFICICILFVCCHDPQKGELTDSSSANDNTTTENTTQPDEQINSIEVIDNAKTEFEKGGYSYISNKDLDKYCTNLVGVKVYVVGEIDDFNEGNIQINLSDEFMLSTFYSDIDYTNYINKGDTVAIFGEVIGSDTYKLTGTSVQMDNCKVFAVGNEARQYDVQTTDASLEQYLVVTDTVANNNSSEISRDEYIALCEKIDYTDVLRNPANYKGKHTVVSGTVDQVIEGFFGSITIYVKDVSGNKWGCVYSYQDGESRILEGDSVTLYGICKGTDTSETILGEQVTLVRVDIDYIN